MKLLIDMNLSPLWVQFLADQGLEAIHWSTIGQASAADSEILDYAGNHGYVVFTHDLDFGMLLAARKTSGPSVIQVRSRRGRGRRVGTRWQLHDKFDPDA